MAWKVNMPLQDMSVGIFEDKSGAGLGRTA